MREGSAPTSPVREGSAPNSPGAPGGSEDWTGRFVRSDKKLGNGTIKLVYQARDEEEGVDVAWNELVQGGPV